jgi:hypothetical protein
VSRDREQDLVRGVFAARAALDDGDIGAAGRILDRLLNLPVVCADCGSRFRWPGELDAHTFRSHGGET